MRNSGVEDGLVKQRNVTDAGCCLCFLVFMLAMVGLGGYGFLTGNVVKLLAPLDGNNKFCGSGESEGLGYDDYKKLYFAAPPNHD